MRQIVLETATYCIFFAIIVVMKKLTSFETVVFFALAHLMAQNTIKEIKK